jgi:hypothetical protein
VAGRPLAMAREMGSGSVRRDRAWRTAALGQLARGRKTRAGSEGGEGKARWAGRRPQGQLAGGPA